MGCAGSPSTADNFSLSDEEYVLYAPITHRRRYTIESLYGEVVSSIHASPGDLLFIKSHVRHKENDLYDHYGKRSSYGPERVDARAFVRISGHPQVLVEPPSFRCGRASSPQRPADPCQYWGLRSIQTSLRSVVDSISRESSISEGQRLKMLSNGWTEDLDADWRRAVLDIRPYPYDSLLFDVHNCLN